MTHMAPSRDARQALVEMDVPTRQSYVMAIVRPNERTFASGVTNVTRNVAWAVGPSLAGVVIQHVLAAPPEEAAHGEGIA